MFSSDSGRSTLFAANDNWAEAGAAPARAAFTAAGAFDLPDAASKDAALVVTAPAGTFTTQLTGVGSATGEALIEMIPPDDRGVWSVWVGLVVGDLQRALHRPSGDWNQAWARWLLLIAYSVPVPRERPAPVWPAKLTSLSALLH